MERTAVYAGSFDPLTNGHLDIIRRASKMFDSLTVAVIVNVSKKPFFSIEERVDIIKKVTEDIPNIKVECFSGLLADYVNENGFSAVIRGLRAVADFENEIHMAQMNARLYTEGTETVFLMTDPSCSFISSSMVKEVASLGGSVHGLVDEYTEEKINSKFK